MNYKWHIDVLNYFVCKFSKINQNLSLIKLYSNDTSMKRYTYLSGGTFGIIIN